MLHRASYGLELGPKLARLDSRFGDSRNYSGSIGRLESVASNGAIVLLRLVKFQAADYVSLQLLDSN